jgi:hypothetical protein
MSRSSVSYTLFGPGWRIENAYFHIGCEFSEVAIGALGREWDGATTGQNLLSEPSIVIHVNAFVDHSKMEHFACVI